MNTQSINTSPLFLLSPSNILEIELERLILYTALQAKGKLNENVNEDAMFGVFSPSTCYPTQRPSPEMFVHCLMPLLNRFTKRWRYSDEREKKKRKKKEEIKKKVSRAFDGDPLTIKHSWYITPAVCCSVGGWSRSNSHRLRRGGYGRQHKRGGKSSWKGQKAISETDRNLASSTQTCTQIEKNKKTKTKQNKQKNIYSAHKKQIQQSASGLSDAVLHLHTTLTFFRNSFEQE